MTEQAIKKIAKEVGLMIDEIALDSQYPQRREYKKLIFNVRRQLKRAIRNTLGN